MPHSWHPTAPLTHLKKRSQILANIRAFFANRGVWEVETPQLARTTTCDPHIASLTLEISGQTHYLQTSPEFAMKRLLAAGSGSIYQLSKVFRAEEQGRLHRMEFTMLEWYRVGFDHHQLMDEMDALLQEILKTPAAKRLTYQAVFLEYLGIDPLSADANLLEKTAHQHGLILQPTNPVDIDFWHHLLMTHLIEPALKKINTQPIFITDFPASQAALAKIRSGTPPVAERFEVYVQGIELANGYHELCDPLAQKKRLVADNQQRKSMQLPEIPVDEELLAALTHGLPACAGVALGVDRLVMLALGEESIEAVMSF
jgi:lysyl-tRNA synthetase class 2